MDDKIHGIKDWREFDFTGNENPDDVLKLLTVPCTCCGLAQPWSHVSLDYGICSNLLTIARNIQTEEVKYRMDKTDSASEIKTEIVPDCFLVKKYRKLFNSHSEYAKINKLKWWGFLKQTQEWNHNGIYQFTKKGAAFLRSQIVETKGIIIWEDKGIIAWRNSRKVNLRDACKTRFTEVAEFLADWLGKNQGRWIDGELF